MIGKRGKYLALADWAFCCVGIIFSRNVETNPRFAVLDVDGWQSTLQ